MSYLKQYEYVLEVERSGGVSQAAERLGISQPTLSKYIKKLESELGLELFDRSTLPIRLTQAGEAFADAGRKLLDVDRRLKKQLGEIRTEGASSLSIGISPSRSPYMLPEIVAAFKDRCPAARLSIEERTTEEMKRHLAEGSLDLLISIYGADMDIFERIELFEEGVLLAVRRDMLEDGISAEGALRTLPRISVGRGQAMWELMARISSELGICEPGIECQSIESALALVRRGIGVTIVPSYITKGCDGEIAFLPISAANAEGACRRVCLFHRKGQILTRTERAFIECTASVCGR